MLLEKEVNNLEEVYVSNSSLTGHLSNDVSNMKVKPLLFEPPKRKKLSSIDRQMLAYGGGLGILIGAITGDLKMLKKAKANSELNEKAYRYLESLPNSIFTEDFGLEEWEIINFMFYCARKNDTKLQELIAKDESLKLIDYFKAEVEEFKKISREGDVKALHNETEN